MAHPSAEEYDATNVVLRELARNIGAEFIESPEFSGTRFFGCVSGTRGEHSFTIRGWQTPYRIKPGEKATNSMKLFNILEFRIAFTGEAARGKLKGRMMPNQSTDEKRWKKVIGKKAPMPDPATRDHILNFLSLTHTHEIHKSGELYLIPFADELRPPTCTAQAIAQFLDTALEGAGRLNAVLNGTDYSPAVRLAS